MQCIVGFNGLSVMDLLRVYTYITFISRDMCIETTANETTMYKTDLRRWHVTNDVIISQLHIQRAFDMTSYDITVYTLQKNTCFQQKESLKWRQTRKSVPRFCCHNQISLLISGI